MTAVDSGRSFCGRYFKRVCDFRGDFSQDPAGEVDEGPVCFGSCQQFPVRLADDQVFSERCDPFHLRNPRTDQDPVMDFCRLQIFDVMRSDDPTRTVFKMAVGRPSLMSRMTGGRVEYPAQIDQVIDVSQQVNFLGNDFASDFKNGWQSWLRIIFSVSKATW